MEGRPSGVDWNTFVSGLVLSLSHAEALSLCGLVMKLMESRIFLRSL